MAYLDGINEEASEAAAPELKLCKAFQIYSKGGRAARRLVLSEQPTTEDLKVTIQGEGPNGPEPSQSIVLGSVGIQQLWDALRALETSRAERNINQKRAEAFDELRVLRAQNGNLRQVLDEKSEKMEAMEQQFKRFISEQQGQQRSAVPLGGGISGGPLSEANVRARVEEYDKGGPTNMRELEKAVMLDRGAAAAFTLPVPRRYEGIGRDAEAPATQADPRGADSI